MLYIGIDLGTSAVKLLLVSDKGQILRTVSEEYPLYFPQPGWSEQNPEDWWQAVLQGLQRLTEDCDTAQIVGIGCAGQMHGLVILDEKDEVIRPAILWNDGRTEKQVAYLNEIIGREQLSKWTANTAFAGFTAPKLLWLKENEPENFVKIRKIMLPKDYINYRLTGVHCTDYSDASGMLLLDVKRKSWSKEMLQLCEITEQQLPKLYESSSVVGTLTKEAAEQLGLSQAVQVVAGAGDNAAAAIGTGTVGTGRCNVSLGTSGTIFISSGEDFRVDQYNALHSFAHADGGYHLMGCMLSAASCNQWLCETILHADAYEAEQKKIAEDALGMNHVYFLPYLMGERSPINDTNARGTLIGFTLDTSRADLVQAVLEGVAFAIRDSFEVAKSLGISITSSKICGGGAKSGIWKKILANVLGIELQSVSSEQGPGLGGAMLAMVGCGAYQSVEEVCKKLVQISEIVRPDEQLTARYQKRYEQFRGIYPACRDLFKSLQA